MTLQARLDEIRANFETNIASAEVVTAFHAHRDRLIDSGQGQRAIGVGQTAPEFELLGRNGNVSLSTLRSIGPVVLSWFRGTW